MVYIGRHARPVEYTLGTAQPALICAVYRYYRIEAPGILRQQYLFSTRYELIRVGYLVAAYVFRTLAQPAQYP